MHFLEFHCKKNHIQRLICHVCQSPGWDGGGGGGRWEGGGVDGRGGGITTLLHKFTISIYYRKKPVLRNIAWHYYVLEILIPNN